MLPKLKELFSRVGLLEDFEAAYTAAKHSTQSFVQKRPNGAGAKKSKREPKAQTTEDATVSSESAPAEPPAELDVAAVLAQLALPAEPPTALHASAYLPGTEDCAPNDSDDE
jgi:hypothetical protein